jgi:RNA:NAD 2'-phosphotransferase (TPT1/KptA family)
MRFKTFLLEANNNFFAKTTLDFVKELGHTKSITPRNTIIVYHGTSKKNADNILKTGKFKGHPWFVLDKSTSEKYAKAHGGKNDIVLTLEIDPSSVLPVAGSYLSARMEGLTIHGKDSNNNVWYIPEKVSK